MGLFLTKEHMELGGGSMRAIGKELRGENGGSFDQNTYACMKLSNNRKVTCRQQKQKLTSGSAYSFSNALA